MELKLINRIVFIIVILMGINCSYGQTTIASWTYDNSFGSLNNPTPAIGVGTSSVVNLVTPTTAQGFSSSTGCGSSNAGLAWQNANFDPGASNEVNGVQYNSSTLNYNGIKVSFDLRFSNTAPNTVRLQYTTNGSTWINFVMTSSNTTYCAGSSLNANGCFETNTGDSFRRVIVDLSAITAANNNSNFGVRILASYFRTTSQYRQATVNTNVATNTGTWRFDNVNFLGTPIVAGAVISGLSTVCLGNSTSINVAITGGVSPYTVKYTDGITTFTNASYITGSPITVTPTSNPTTYTLVSVTDNASASITPISGSAIINVNPTPTPTFTTAPPASTCLNTDIVYTTQAGMDNYTWTFLKGAATATLGSDYTITAGDLTIETVTIRWIVAASYTVKVRYSSGGCPGSDVSSTITVNPLPTITATTPAAICSGTTSISLPYTGLTGSSLKYYIAWSSTPSNSFVPVSNATIVASPISVAIPSTASGGTYTGTLSVTNSSTGCPSLGSSFTVQVNARAAITTQPTTGGQSVCLGNAFSALTVVASGTGTLSYQWYRNPNNVSVASGGWVSLTGATYAQEVINGSKTASFVPLSNTVGTYYYYVKITNTSAPCTTGTANSVVCGPYTVYQAVGGTVSGDTNVCIGTNSTTLTLSGYTSSVLKWQLSPSSNFSSGVVDIVNNTPTLTVNNISTTTYYRAVVTDGPGNLCSTTSSVATLTVIPLSIGGTLSGGGTVCSSSTTTVLTLSGYTGNIINWQSSPVSDFSSGVITIPNTTPTLSANVLQTTYYRAVVQNTPCSVAYSSVDSIQVFTTTWNGASWDNGVPNSSTKAVLANPYNESTNLQACSLQVLAGVVATVPSGYTFTIQNEVIVDPSALPTALIFEDDASLIQVNNVINTSAIHYRRNSMPIKKFDYTYWSTPVSNETISGFSPNTSLSYVWDTTIYNWKYVSNSTIMTPGKGYILRAPDIAPFNTSTTNIFNGEFYGFPNNGTITTPISFTASTPTDKDMNLIGNPYPSAIDADSFLIYNRPSNGGVLNGTIFYWTHNTPITANGGTYNYSYNDYASYNLTGGVGTANQSPSSVGCPTCNATIPNGMVGAGQSFFIQGLGNGVATFTNAMRSGINSQFYKNSPNSGSQIEKNRLWLDISNQNGLFKQVLIGYIEGATNEFDNSFDGLSVDAGNPIMIYSLLDDKKLGIQGRALPFDVNDIIAIGYKSTVAGNFEIKLSNFDGIFSNQDVYLEDTLTNTYFNLKTQNYSFATEAGTFDNRFSVHFVDSTLHTYDPVNSSFIVYQNQNQITINAGTILLKDVEVYDIRGRILSSYKNILSSVFSFASPASTEILVLKITTSENAIFYKKIVN